MKDALGVTLEVGDWVAYVSRHGSTVNIESRKVSEINEEYLLLEPLTDWRGNTSRSGQVKPKNVVKSFAQ